MTATDGSTLQVSQVTTSNIPDLIRVKASKYELPIEIVCAIIWQESHGDGDAFRYEPGFYRRHLAQLKRHELSGFVPEKLPTLNTEKVCRATSWGAMQVLGETARAHGFKDEKLWKLVYWENSLEFGCKYLRNRLNLDSKKKLSECAELPFFKQYLVKARLTEDEKILRYKMAFLRYNGGGNLLYPEEVWKHVTNGNWEKVLTMHEKDKTNECE